MGGSFTWGAGDSQMVQQRQETKVVTGDALSGGRIRIKTETLLVAAVVGLLAFYFLGD